MAGTVRGSRALGIVARMGYAGRALLYGAVGGLALSAALRGAGSQAKGSTETLQEIGLGPIGGPLVLAAAVGLAAFALWQLARAVFDPERAHQDNGRRATRIGFAFSAIIHAGLAVAALQVALGGGGGGGDAQTTWISEVLTWPAGAVLVAIGGLGVVGYGVHQLAQGWQGDQDDAWETGRMPGWLKRAGEAIARVGLAARGVVLCLIGGFVVYAGVTAVPSESKGLGESLQALAAAPFGSLLLAVVAAGLVAYAIFQLIEAVYRRVPG